MRFTWKQLRLATLSMFMLGAVGCGSFSHSYEASPLSFFLPFVQNESGSTKTPLRAERNEAPAPAFQRLASAK